jgi:diguanylate cyclase (GGDEF)-like protein
MFTRLRAFFVPRLEFEQRAYRARLAARILIGYALLLAAWLAIRVLLQLKMSPRASSYDLRQDFLLVGLLAPAGVVAFLLLRRGWLYGVGYVLAGSVYLASATSLVLVPGGLSLYTPLLVLAILIAGAIIGGEAAFIFAGLAVATGAISWWLASGPPNSQPGSIDLSAGLLYFVTLTIASFSTASILHSFSHQVQHSLRRLHEQAERLATLANTDPLTGMANRRHLLDQLDREYKRARRYRRPLSLVYIDLDGFKAVNDQYGHLYGDEVLKGAATGMKSVLRATDLMARIGGDEFAILMPETTLEGAKNAMAKLHRALSALTGRMQPAVSDLDFCAGVSQMRDDDSAQSMLGRADESQYLAKASGKGQTRTEEDLEHIAFEG